MTIKLRVWQYHLHYFFSYLSSYLYLILWMISLVNATNAIHAIYLPNRTNKIRSVPCLLRFSLLNLNSRVTSCQLMPQDRLRSCPTTPRVVLSSLCYALHLSRQFFTLQSNELVTPSIGYRNIWFIWLLITWLRLRRADQSGGGGSIAQSKE